MRAAGLLAAAGLVSAALVVASPRARRAGASRLSSPGTTGPAGGSAVTATAEPGPAAVAGPGGVFAGERRRVLAARVAAGAAGVAVAVVVGGWLGVLLGAAAGTGSYRWVSRLEPRHLRAVRQRAAADLPLAADLLAAALAAGLPVDRAAAAVGAALGGPLGERLTRVARALSLGATPARAWCYLQDIPGAERLVRPAVRSADSGAALARALIRLAEDLRTARAAAGDAAARRAAVLVVLPLGLCFLPAFILAGLVPVIVAILGGVL